MQERTQRTVRVSSPLRSSTQSTGTDVTPVNVSPRHGPEVMRQHWAQLRDAAMSHQASLERSLSDTLRSNTTPLVSTDPPRERAASDKLPSAAMSAVLKDPPPLPTPVMVHYSSSPKLAASEMIQDLQSGTAPSRNSEAISSSPPLLPSPPTTVPTIMKTQSPLEQGITEMAQSALAREHTPCEVVSSSPGGDASQRLSIAQLEKTEQSVHTQSSASEHKQQTAFATPCEESFPQDEQPHVQSTGAQIDVDHFSTNSAYSARQSVMSVGGRSLGGSIFDGIGDAASALKATVSDAATPRVRSTVTYAGVGAVGLGTAGGTIGGAIGGAAGAVVGLGGALFTFGLSIPVGMAIGAGLGVGTGAAAGSTAGLAIGGVTGYHKEELKAGANRLLSCELEEDLPGAEESGRARAELADACVDNGVAGCSGSRVARAAVPEISGVLC